MHFYVLQARVVNGELKVQAFYNMMHIILILHRNVARRLGKGGKMRLTIRLLFHYYVSQECTHDTITILFFLFLRGKMS